MLDPWLNQRVTLCVACVAHRCRTISQFKDGAFANSYHYHNKSFSTHERPGVAEVDQKMCILPWSLSLRSTCCVTADSWCWVCRLHASTIIKTSNGLPPVVGRPSRTQEVKTRKKSLHNHINRSILQNCRDAFFTFWLFSFLNVAIFSLLPSVSVHRTAIYIPVHGWSKCGGVPCLRAQAGFDLATLWLGVRCFTT